MTENLKTKMDTIIRLVILVLALINQILTSTGHPVLPIDNEMATQLITLLFTAFASIVAYWKNNSWTKEAKQADEYLKTLKDGESE